MTGAEWLTCDDPVRMLNALPGGISERKLRLFGVACCRAIWVLLDDDRSRTAVAVAEQLADGTVGRDQLVEARDAAREAKRRFHGPAQVHAWRAANAAQDVTRDNARSAALNSVAEVCRAMNAHDTNHFDGESLRRGAALLRCIFGNPFAVEAMNPKWMTPAVVSLASAIYNERRFDRMTELADVLQYGGCDHATILAHCRAPGEHFRGCWVVDTILGNRVGRSRNARLS
jgi:hypothetical protein